MPATSFAHLHVHTEFSSLDGLGDVKAYAARAKELGQPAIAITDHGNLCGVPSFYHACRKEEVEPIIGSEFYFVPDAEREKTATKAQKAEAGDDKRFHVVILARGERGYQVLSELSTETHRNFHYKPLLDRRMVEALGDDAQHLVCLSGCAASAISRAVRAKDMRKARAEVLWWRECFPHFYMELQEHGTEFDHHLNLGLLALARKYRIPWVITNDPHYVVEEDAPHHDTLLAIQTASDVDDPNRFRFDGSGYHLRSRAEMVRAFRPYGAEVYKAGIQESLRIAQMCHVRIGVWETRHWHIPKFKEGVDGDALLRKLSFAGLKAKGLETNGRYRSQMLMELKAFKQVGISDFMLITRDILRWATKQGIPVGPGRGSVCGTLVGYLVGIHKMDPIRYDLMFERFLNPARPRMPDVDSDFGPARRDEVFEYVERRYGHENVVHVAAFPTMKVKAAFRSLAKSYGVSYVDSNRLSKMLPDVLPEEGGGEEWTEEFRVEIMEKYPDLYATLRRLAGIKRSVSAHPAGVIIGEPDTPIRQLVPEMWLASSKRMCGQYDLEAVEEMGLLKQDLLAVRTLETIAEAVRLVEQTTGERLDPDSWVPDEEDRDDEVYAMLGRGETAGVFQMEGPTNQRGIKAVGCGCFEDIVSTTSLYRTGPIQSGFPKVFIDNRRAGTIKYLHPKLKPILERTWGVVLYQEQVMAMGEELAGFTMIQVDDIKEAIKHKKSKLMESMGPLFIKGCVKRSGIYKAVAERIWKMIESYSGYSYNRSHAVAYTFITYQTARLKCLYPAEFITALLRTVDDKAKREGYMREVIRAGLRILPPEVNSSDAKVTAGRGCIRFGFQDVAGIGEAKATRLLEGRPEGGYRTLQQVEKAVRDRGVVERLAQVGALLEMGVEADDTKQAELLHWQFVDPLEEIRERYGSRVVLPGENGGGVCLVGEIIKVDSPGKTKDGKPYLTWHLRWSNVDIWNVRLWSECEPHFRLPQGTIVMVVGKWEPRWENVSVGNPKSIKVLRKVKVVKQDTKHKAKSKAKETSQLRLL